MQEYRELLYAKQHQLLVQAIGTEAEQQRKLPQGLNSHQDKKHTNDK